MPKRHAMQVSNSNGINCRCLKGNCTEHTSTYFLLRMKTPKNNLPRPQLQIRYANSHGTPIYPPTLTSIYNYREYIKFICTGVCMCMTTYTPQLLCCEWPVHHVSCGRTPDGWDTASGVFSATFAGKDLPASVPHPPQCSLLGQLTLKQNGQNSNQFKTACNQVPRKTHIIQIFHIYTHFTVSRR